MRLHIRDALTHPRRRRRVGYALACLAAIGAGLASRRFPQLLPAVLGKYPGDTLWALMAFCGLGAIWRTGSTARLGIATLGICVAVEFLKLWEAPWLVSARQSPIGHLVFGHAFHPPNLIAYAVGVGIGVLVEWSIHVISNDQGGAE